MPPRRGPQLCAAYPSARALSIWNSSPVIVPSSREFLGRRDLFGRVGVGGPPDVVRHLFLRDVLPRGVPDGHLLSIEHYVGQATEEREQQNAQNPQGFYPPWPQAVRAGQPVSAPWSPITWRAQEVAALEEVQLAGRIRGRMHHGSLAEFKQDVVDA